MKFVWILLFLPHVAARRKPLGFVGDAVNFVKGATKTDVGRAVVRQVAPVGTEYVLPQDEAVGDEKCGGGSAHYRVQGNKDSDTCPSGQKINTYCCKCSPGTFQPKFNNAECPGCCDWDGSCCLSCPKGYFNTGIGQAGCSRCPGGFYQPTKAPLGSFNGPTACIECGLGQVIATRETGCETCRAGTFVDRATADGKCTKCLLRNTYSLAGQEGDCIVCPQGFFSKQEAVQVQSKFPTIQGFSFVYGYDTVYYQTSCEAGSGIHEEYQFLLNAYRSEGLYL